MPLQPGLKTVVLHRPHSRVGTLVNRDGTAYARLLIVAVDDVPYKVLGVSHGTCTCQELTCQELADLTRAAPVKGK